MNDPDKRAGANCWLRFAPIAENGRRSDYCKKCASIIAAGRSEVLQTARRELADALTALTSVTPLTEGMRDKRSPCVLIGAAGAGNAEIDAAAEAIPRQPDAGGSDEGEFAAGRDGYVIRSVRRTADSPSRIVIAGRTERGALYGTFHFIRLLQRRERIDELDIREAPANGIRMINQWDNTDGTIERGYAGKSIFFHENKLAADLTRVRQYARLLASVGINAISVNNVNVRGVGTELIGDDGLPSVRRLGDLFRPYGIRLFLSVNFAAPVELGGLDTADPLDPAVRRWWATRAAALYEAVPDFGGFLVKADSEFRPGPFTYGRDHADGANMLAEALAPHGGLVVWRCFVYDCRQDWRDRSTDRAKAACDHFKPLDGRFADNVLLQIKNGPMDFQVREPVSPLFGALRETHQLLELQITQEYTGQQRHLCYLVPQWKEALDFDTFAAGNGSTVANIVSGRAFGRRLGGIAAVSNIGDDANWTGHPLAQANLYGYGRLAWNPGLDAGAIAREWAGLTFGRDPRREKTIVGMLLRSWPIYESYTAPLGVGWMVNPHHHYGPNVDGYEYSAWGTYHFADCRGIGVDRTVATGTGYAGQYRSPQRERFESLELCPDELLLFFHHVPYTHRLKSGKTVIQHIYDSRFEGAEAAQSLLDEWLKLEGTVDRASFDETARRLTEQAAHAKEWRDVVNTYFYRKSGIEDERRRRIY